MSLFFFLTAEIYKWIIFTCLTYKKVRYFFYKHSTGIFKALIIIYFRLIVVNYLMPRSVVDTLLNCDVIVSKCYIIKEWFFYCNHFSLIIFYLSVWFGFELFGLRVQVCSQLVQFTLVRKGYENHLCHKNPWQEMGRKCGWCYAQKRWAENSEDFEKDSVEVRPWCWEVEVRSCSWGFEIRPCR